MHSQNNARENRWKLDQKSEYDKERKQHTENSFQFSHSRTHILVTDSQQCVYPYSRYAREHEYTYLSRYCVMYSYTHNEAHRYYHIFFQFMLSLTLWCIDVILVLCFCSLYTFIRYVDSIITLWRFRNIYENELFEKFDPQNIWPVIEKLYLNVFKMSNPDPNSMLKIVALACFIFALRLFLVVFAKVSHGV